MNSVSETINHREFSIEICHDHHGVSPWDAGDCEPPILVYAGRDGFREHGDGGLADITLTEAEAREHWRPLLGLLGYPETWRGLLTFARADYDTHGYPLAEVLADRACEHARGETGTDRLEALANLWRLRGCAAVTKTVTGHCQGDWAEVLAVATPDWSERVGAPVDTHEKQIEYAARLYGWWAFGDVYGWRVIDPEGEEIDSCWGYYGPDHGQSGLIADARAAIEPAADQREAEQTEKARYWAAARHFHHDDGNVEIREGADVALSDGGAYVTASIWIPAEAAQQ